MKAKTFKRIFLATLAMACLITAGAIPASAGTVDTVKYTSNSTVSGSAVSEALKYGNTSVGWCNLTSSREYSTLFSSKRKLSGSVTTTAYNSSAYTIKEEYARVAFLEEDGTTLISGQNYTVTKYPSNWTANLSKTYTGRNYGTVYCFSRITAKMSSTATTNQIILRGRYYKYV